MKRRRSKRAPQDSPAPPEAPLATQQAPLAELEHLLNHSFARPALLTLALTHRSFVYDTAGAPSQDLADPGRDNEQLEFVGDAVLGLLAAEGLCRRFPASREGELTRMRASVVSRKHLGEVGTRLGLGRWLRLGRTAETNEGRRSAALFSNAIEALIAALYLDGGLDPARRFVEDQVIAPAIPALERSLAGADAAAGVGGAVGDHKSALQETLQSAGRPRPEYRLLAESGPDHRRVFHVEVSLDGAPRPFAEGHGSSKKQAQQEAARLALLKLQTASASLPVPRLPELQPVQAHQHA